MDHNRQNTVHRSMTSAWLERFPALRGLEQETHHALLENARSVSVPAGAKAFRAGGDCDNYLLVLSGTIRIQQLAESGREIVLYRVGAGETCILTTACLLAREAYSAEAIAEMPVEAIAVPKQTFDRLIARSPAFRDFVFATYAKRITDLMLLIEEVAFGRIDARLARCLLDLKNPDGTLLATHQSLAVELGTAREVVSRQLKEFERRRWVRLERGGIHVLEPKALEALAEEAR
jgi:CRP/FNR family transcriptional regulator, anaerobic regulatory protein